MNELTLIEWCNIVLASDPGVGQSLNLAGGRVGDGRREFALGPERIFESERDDLGDSGIDIGPEVFLVPFHSVSVPLLVVVCPSLFSVSPCHPQPVQIGGRACGMSAIIHFRLNKFSRRGGRTTHPSVVRTEHSRHLE